MKKIAVLISLTSKKQNLQTVDDIGFFRSSLPSFIETIQKDINGLPENHFYFYFGYDEYDPFYDNQLNISLFVTKFNRQVEQAGFGNFFSIPDMKCFIGTDNAPTHVWNRLFEIAYSDKCDYFFQVGDDITYKTLGWDRDFITTLNNNKNGKGLGVCGPLDLGYTRIITQSFVSRVHMEIFGTMFPWIFKNCYMDTWISQVYGDMGTFFLKQHQIYNEFGIPRYQRYMRSREYLEDELNIGKKNIYTYCKSRFICTSYDSDIKIMKKPKKIVIGFWLELGNKSYVFCLGSTFLKRVLKYLYLFNIEKVK